MLEAIIRGLFSKPKGMRRPKSATANWFSLARTLVKGTAYEPLAALTRRPRTKPRRPRRPRSARANWRNLALEAARAARR